jgi:hypothetical protein
MDALLFHPKVVHIPMALGVLMPIIAGGLLLAWWRNWLPRRSWFLVIGFQAILFGSGVLALRTGEAEEDRVERVVAERFIEKHEEAADGPRRLIRHPADQRPEASEITRLSHL